MMTKRNVASLAKGIGLALALGTTATIGAVSAQEIADEITIQVGFSPGAGFDLFARTAAVHLPKHIPGNPNVVVENVPGAGSLLLLRQFLATGRTDGTQLAMINHGLAINAITDPDNTDFDTAALNWIVSFSNFPTYCIATVASGVTTLDEMLAGGFVTGSAGRDNTYTLSLAVSNSLGGNFNLVTGFSGAAEVNLAMARGEVDGTCGRSYGSMERLAEVVDFVVIAELSPVRFDLIEGAEFLLDRVDDQLNKDALSLLFSQNLIWGPIVAHPDTPDEIITILRDAFAALATDEAFLADAEERLLVPVITDGAAVQALVEGVARAPMEVQDRARALIVEP